MKLSQLCWKSKVYIRQMSKIRKFSVILPFLGRNRRSLCALVVDSVDRNFELARAHSLVDHSSRRLVVGSRRLSLALQTNSANLVPLSNSPINSYYQDIRHCFIVHSRWALQKSPWVLQWNSGCLIYQFWQYQFYEQLVYSNPSICLDSLGSLLFFDSFLNENTNTTKSRVKIELQTS